VTPTHASFVKFTLSLGVQQDSVLCALHLLFARRRKPTFGDDALDSLLKTEETFDSEETEEDQAKPVADDTAHPDKPDVDKPQDPDGESTRYFLLLILQDRVQTTAGYVDKKLFYFCAIFSEIICFWDECYFFLAKTRDR